MESLQMYKIWYSLTSHHQKKSLDDFLKLIIQDQYKGPPHASEHVRPGSLEESFGAFVTRDLPPAVDGAGVHDVSYGAEKFKHLPRPPSFFPPSSSCKVMLSVVVVTSFASRLHHHASTDGVEGVGHEASDGGHALSDHPAHHDVCVLGVRKHSCEINGPGKVTHL